MKRLALDRVGIGPLATVLTILLLGGYPNHLHAQATNIASSGLNTAISNSGTTTFIDGGTRPGGGPNLFHSFGEFSVGEGHTALFRNSDAGATSNIFGRVTGNSISTIFGTIDTATNFPTANLWLINPNGFLFGPTAALNVGGSVNISSADYLKHADGTRFNALPGPADALLSMAPVEAFGFLERQSIDPTFGRIMVNGAQLGTSDPQQQLKALSFVGRDLVFTEAQLDLTAKTAPLDLLLASVASRGEVRVTPLLGVSGISSQVSTGTRLGSITLGGTNISPSAKRFGVGDPISSRMRFFGDTLTMRDSSIDSSPFPISGTTFESIELNLARRLIVGENSEISASSRGRSEERGNAAIDLFIRAPVVEVNGGGSIYTSGHLYIVGDSVTITNGGIYTLGKTVAILGGAGDLVLNLRQGLFLGTNGYLGSIGPVDGVAGSVTIQASVIDINGGSIRVSDLGGFSLRDRKITISGDTVRMKNGEISTAITRDDTSLFRSVGSDSIEFDLTGTLFLGQGAKISSASLENVPSGEIIIHAANVHLQGGTIDTRSAAAATDNSNPEFPLGVGKAGNITIQTVDGIRLTAGSTITSEFTGPGKAGNIILNAGRDLRIENGRISTATSLLPSLDTEGFVGTAGEIRLIAGNNIQLRNGQITTTSEDGSGGNIKLTAPNVIRIADNSTLSSSVNGPPGSNGGNISIDPVAVAIQNSQILANANAGAGGTINVIASGAVLVDPNSRLDASAGPAGISGSVNINAPIQVLGGTLVPLKVSYSQAALSGDRCAADPQGQFSSFVQTGRDGVPTMPGAYAPSPLFVLDRLLSSARGSKPVNLAAARLGLAGSTHFQFQSGCRS